MHVRAVGIGRAGLQSAVPKGACVRRNLMIATTSALVLLAACGDSGHDLDPLGPPPEASPTGNVSPAVTSPTSATGGPGTVSTSGGPVPTTSPGITGSVDVGNATITVSGALQTSQPTLPLASPAIYSPPPGTFTLAWSTAAVGVALGGTSFIGTRPTSATLRLTFFVHSVSSTATFAPGDGGCDVTVTAAAANAFDGTFSCTGVTDVNGTLTVDAQGTFSASG
jgi:hypothetical protein